MMFCRIYTNGNKIKRQFVFFQLCDLLKEKPIDNNYIENDIFDISISDSDEIDIEKSNEFPDGFLYFPVNIEIDFKLQNEQEAAFIINKILYFLWNNGYSAIASWKFEELLVEKGGYKSKNIPWTGKR